MVIGEEEAGEGAFRRVVAEEQVDGLEEAPGLDESEGDLAAEVRLEVRHEEGGGHPFPHHVPDDEAQAVGAQAQEVVVVAAHRLRRKASAGVVERLQGGHGLGEEPGLHLPGDRELVDGAALRFELVGGGAPLGFHGMSDLVEADEGEGIPVGVAKAGEDAAPHGLLVAEHPGRRSESTRRRVVLDPPEPRSAHEADPLPRPLLEPAGHVGGDEHDMGGAADEPVLGGPRWGDDEGEDGGAVGRGDRDPALARLKAGIDDESEAELLEVEAEAPVEVAHEDAHRVDAEEGRRDTRREGAQIPAYQE